MTELGNHSREKKRPTPSLTLHHFFDLRILDHFLPSSL
jgi:hypothetical protein